MKLKLPLEETHLGRPLRLEKTVGDKGWRVAKKWSNGQWALTNSSQIPVFTDVGEGVKYLRAMRKPDSFEITYNNEHCINDIVLHYVVEHGVSVGVDAHDKTEGNWTAVRRSRSPSGCSFIGRGVTRDEAVADAMKQAAVSRQRTEWRNEI